MAANPHLPTILILLSIIPISSTFRVQNDCVYTLYVRTGSIMKGGTDSIITLTLYDAYYYGIRINNLATWAGLMGPAHNYFERDNLDIFSGRGPCLPGPVCAINITADGSGNHHGWYCNYVEVTVAGVHRQCAQRLFTVESWLATNTAPFQLTAIRNLCPSGNFKGRNINGRSGLKLASVD